MSAFYNVDQPPFNMGSTARAIAAANNGLLFDIGDMSTLFQDAAGTVPVTAVEQPVGKILDKSGNGNHATQPITASRPTLSARYNLLAKTEDFADGFWGKVGTSATTNQMINGVAFNKLTADTSTGEHYTQSGVAVIPSGSILSLSCLVKSDGSSNNVRLMVFGPNPFPQSLIDVDLTTGAISPTANSGGVITSSSCTDIGGGVFLIAMSGTVSTAATIQARVAIIGAGSNVFTGNGIDGVYATKIELRIGTTYVPYQRVNTATDYDTNPALFPKYLKFDGVDDYLSLPYMGLYAGGSASVVCSGAFSKTGVEATILGERSSSSTSPAYRLAFKGAGEWLSTQIRLDDGVTYLNAAESFVANLGTDEPKIFSIIDSRVKCSPRINGILGIEKTYTRSGTITLNNTVFGATVTSTSGAFLRANIYGLIITKSTLTDAQRVRCERLLARKAGVML